VEPAIFLLEMIHTRIKLVQELISKKMVVSQVELTASIPETIVVSGTREVEPFRVTELVTLKIEVAFTTETICDETDHFVKCHASLNDRGELSKGRHVRVQLSIAKMHHD
jgi:hypothetical protein